MARGGSSSALQGKEWGDSIPTLYKHSLLHYTGFQIVPDDALNPSPIFFKIMNLPFAAKLIIFKKYFYVF